MNFLHLSHLDKFIPPYIDFVKKYDNLMNHKFLILKENSKYSLPKYDQVKVLGKGVSFYINLLKALRKNDHIFIHGLYNFRLIILLFLFPDFLKKTTWVLWGSDLYTRDHGVRNLKWRIKEHFRRFVIKRVQRIVTTVPGDYDLCRHWYRTRATFSECLMYESHVVRELRDQTNLKRKNSCLNIQVGNSADPANNHLEVFKKLSLLDLSNVMVYVPLSYGDAVYTKVVVKAGQELLGNKFHPILEYVDFDEYTRYLSTIDVAVFNHSRQQAMGNIIGLLSLGKKVYLRSDITPWNYFISKGVKVFDTTEQINFSKLAPEQAIKNQELMREKFSLNILIRQWKILLGRA